MAIAELTAVDAHAWVDAAPFRAKLRELVDGSGLPWRVVALAISLPAGVARTLLFGREGRLSRRIRSVDAERILAASDSQLRRLDQLPADVSNLKLAVSLLSSQLTDVELTDQLQISEQNLSALRMGRSWATQLTYLRAQALCEELAISLDEWTEQLNRSEFARELKAA